VDPEPLARKPWWRRWFGTRSERAALRFLRKKKGYRIVARNYSCKLGELDLVAVDGTCVVFVEVRSTETGEIERPAASVDAAKQRRLTQLALHFLQAKKLLNQAARFDVLAISWPIGAKEPNIVHYQNAFEAVGRFQMFS
jgi:putative endonuclease